MDNDKPMFTVEIDGKSYSVSFTRDKSVVHRATFCAIYRTDGTKGGEDGEPLYTGYEYPSITFCHPNDNFNKNEGRKWALKYALNNRGFSRDARRKFWEAYFKARGKVN